MFCKGISFLLLFRSLAASTAKPRQCSDHSSCKGKESRQSLGVSILQVESKLESKQARANPVSLEEKTHTKFTHTNFGVVEHWQELMQYDLFPPEPLSQGELSVSKEEWVQAFDKLDKNGDGQLDGYDLDGAYAETASHHLNVSTDHYRLAVAEMSENFPEFSSFAITHQPAICYFAETNTSAPHDAPVPDEKYMTVFAQRSRKLALLEELSGCEQALGKIAYEALSLGLKFANIQIKDVFGDQPPPEWMGQLETLHREVNKDLLKQIGDALVAHAWEEAAGHLWILVEELHAKGALTPLIQLAYDHMGWWAWWDFSVNVIAAVTAHIGGGMKGQLAQFAMAEGQSLVPLAYDAFNVCW